MDFKSHNIIVPLHTYDSCVELWKTVHGMEDRMFGYNGIIHSFENLRLEYKYHVTVIDEFKKHCVNQLALRNSVYRRESCNKIVRDFLNKWYGDIFNHESAREYLDAHPMDYIEEIVKELRCLLDEIQHIDDSFKNLFACPDDIIVSSQFQVSIPFDDYEEFRTMDKRISFCRSCVSAMIDELIKYGNDKMNLFNKYFVESLFATALLIKIENQK